MERSIDASNEVDEFQNLSIILSNFSVFLHRGNDQRRSHIPLRSYHICPKIHNKGGGERQVRRQLEPDTRQPIAAEGSTAWLKEPERATIWATEGIRHRWDRICQPNHKSSLLPNQSLVRRHRNFRFPSRPSLRYFVRRAARGAMHSRSSASSSSGIVLSPLLLRSAASSLRSTTMDGRPPWTSTAIFAATTGRRFSVFSAIPSTQKLILCSNDSREVNYNPSNSPLLKTFNATGSLAGGQISCEPSKSRPHHYHFNNNLLQRESFLLPSSYISHICQYRHEMEDHVKRRRGEYKRK